MHECYLVATGRVFCYCTFVHHIVDRKLNVLTTFEHFSFSRHPVVDYNTWAGGGVLAASLNGVYIVCKSVPFNSLAIARYAQNDKHAAQPCRVTRLSSAVNFYPSLLPPREMVRYGKTMYACRG
jgi:hypothetical protein